MAIFERHCVVNKIATERDNAQTVMSLDHGGEFLERRKGARNTMACHIMRIGA